jgi:hypothetical protein
MMTTSFSQYWHLFRWLMIPERYHYWLFMLSMVVSVVAVFSVVAGSLLKIGDWHLVIVGIWAVVFSLWFFRAVFVLHGQLLSLPSNRQLRLIPGVRQRALVIHWVVVTIMTLLFTACQYFLKEMEFTLSGVIVNWTLFSLASVILLLCLKFSLLGAWFFGMVFSAYIWPLGISPWLLLLLSFVVCISLSYWWLRWLPVQKIDNIFLMSNWQALQRTSLNHWTKLPINMLAPRFKNNYTTASLYVHLLNGVTGIVVSRVIIWLLMSSFAILSFSLIALLGYGGAMRDMAQVAILITLWVFLSSAGMGYFTGLFANIGRVWFYFPGTRAELLRVVEKNFMSLMLIDLFFICALIGLACYWVLPEYLQVKWVLLYGLLVLALNWALFHFVWYLHCRTQGSSNSLGAAIFFIIMMQIFLSGVSWSLVSGGNINAELLAMGAIVCCFLGAIFMRAYAQKATPKMCFAQGKV